MGVYINPSSLKLTPSLASLRPTSSSPSSSVCNSIVGKHARSIYIHLQDVHFDDGYDGDHYDGDNHYGDGHNHYGGYNHYGDGEEELSKCHKF